MLRVLLVENEAWAKASIASLLGGRPDAQAVLSAACSTAAAALEHVAAGMEFDVGLIALALPDTSGVDLIRKLHRLRPEAVLVVFTVYDDPDTVFAALRAGAHGYLLKSTPPDRLISALADAYAGGAPLSPAIARMIIESLHGAPREQTIPPSRLTRRETEVLTLLAKGITYAQVGIALGIALGTVQAHVRKIYEKLEIGSKAEAAVVAAKLGFV